MSSLTALAASKPQFQAPDPLDALRDPRAPSGFHGVEAHNQGFRGRIPFLKSPMPTRPTAREAAADVLAWWEAHFGVRWRRYFAKRSAVPWRPERTESGRYRLVVLVRGREWRPTQATFPDRAGVRRHFVRWARQRYGRGAVLLLRQAA